MLAKAAQVKAAHTEKGNLKLTQEVESLLNPPTGPYKDRIGLIAMREEELLGVAITCSRIDECDLEEVNTTCREILSGKKLGDALVVGVNIDEVNVKTIRKGTSVGKEMAILTVTDNSCSMADVCVFAECYEEFSDLLVEGNTVLLFGTKDKKRGSFIVKKVGQI